VTLAEAQQIAVQVMRLYLFDLRMVGELPHFEAYSVTQRKMITELEAAIAKLEEAK
jgi:hypothetical protein